MFHQSTNYQLHIPQSFLILPSAQVSIDYDPIIENAAAYLQGWLKVLKEDKMFIFKVKAEAQKAADCVLGAKRD